MKTQYNILFVMLSFLLFGPLNLVKPSWAATPADHSIYAVLLEILKPKKILKRNWKQKDQKSRLNTCITTGL